MSGNGRKFYVGIFKEDEDIIGHTSASTAEDASKIEAGTDLVKHDSKESINADLNFEGVFRAYTSMMETYRSFIPITLDLAPAIVSAMSGKKIEKFASQNGKIIEACSNDTSTIYEFNIEHFREFSMYQGEIVAAARGVSHIPEVMIIGLISSYDAFLSNLLRVIFRNHEKIIFKSEKNIPYNEISAFTTIEDARSYLIDKEVENVIRQSHHEQFAWMEKNLDVKLREGLKIWPAFIELCERRNLLTHTGGVISQQYVRNCAIHKCNVSNPIVGNKVKISPEYFSDSVAVMYELGIKLCYVMWRKFQKDENLRADTVLNEMCFDLIFNGAYAIAESILTFSVQVLKKGGADRTRRMMVVNLATSIRLQGRVAEAQKVIDNEDWSAVGDSFKICAASARGDVDEVVRLIKYIGPNSKDIDAENYRIWPVFREMRKDDRFISAFREVFQTDLIKSTSSVVLQSPEIEATS